MTIPQHVRDSADSMGDEDEDTDDDSDSTPSDSSSTCSHYGGSLLLTLTPSAVNSLSDDAVVREGDSDPGIRLIARMIQSSFLV
jgi:hypothetical protein